MSAALIAGCGFSRQEVLETQLREQEATIRRLETELADTQSTVAEQDRSLLALRRSGTSTTTKPGGATTSLVSSRREIGSAWGAAAGLRIHSLTTGILQPDDGGPPTLNVVVQPLDEDGEVVKAAGKLQVTLSTVRGSAADSVTIVDHQLSITDCRSTWNRGLVASGFHLQIPISEAGLLPADGQRLLLTATLDLGDERALVDSRLIDAGR